MFAFTIKLIPYKYATYSPDTSSQNPEYTPPSYYLLVIILPFVYFVLNKRQPVTWYQLYPSTHCLDLSQVLRQRKEVWRHIVIRPLYSDSAYKTSNQ